MPDLDPNHTPPAPRRYLAPLIGLGIVLLLVLAACPLGVLAVQQRAIAPPSFAFNIGEVEFAAPCPKRGFVCYQPLPWYAIWRGDPEPDGTVTYRQLFFMYLRPSRQR